MTSHPFLAILLAGLFSASQFAADVRAEGPRAAVQKLVDGGDWPRAMAAIKGGAADWIAMAPELARGSDAAHGGELSAALAAALPRAPSEVLAVTDVRRSPILGVQILCGAPAGAYGTGGKAAYLADAREAVELLPDVASVGRVKAACLKELADAAR